MPVEVAWWDVGLRVVLTIVASAAIGFDRKLRGHPAGMGTMILVGLAACLAMIEANMLLATVGKSKESFAVADVLRFPLGILTGVGFIGGGAILKHGNSISGLTTAATLWFVTVVGLCFGAGELMFGAFGTAIGLGALVAAKRVEDRLRTERPAELRIRARRSEFDLEGALADFERAGLTLSSLAIVTVLPDDVGEFRLGLDRDVLPNDLSVPYEIARLSARPGVLEWEWKG